MIGRQNHTRNFWWRSAWVTSLLSQTNFKTQTNKPKWQTIAFFKLVIFQCSKTTFLKQKMYLHSLYFSQNMLVLSEPRRVPVIFILLLDFARFAIGVTYSRFGAVFLDDQLLIKTFLGGAKILVCINGSFRPTNTPLYVVTLVFDSFKQLWYRKEKVFFWVEKLFVELNFLTQKVGGNLGVCVLRALDG